MTVHPDPAAQARELVAGRFPDALAAFLGGSTAAGRATPTSDLDLAVVLPAGRTTLRDTTREQGRIVEWFVHTEETVDHFLKEGDRRGVMLSVYAEGILLVDRDGTGSQLAEKARLLFMAGPPSRTTDEVEALRYNLTDLVDDLADATDPHEQLATADLVLGATAELLCELRDVWIGRGKWLPRRVLTADRRLGRQLLDAHLHLARTGDAAPLLATAVTVLDEAGGALREGFYREWTGKVDASADTAG